MIKVNTVRKVFDTKVAIDDISFEVHPGKIFGLLGPNGAGKTTLIRMLLDILKPDTGEILINEHKLTTEDKNIIGYLPEERGLYKTQKVIDVLIYLAMLKELKENDARQNAESYLRKLELFDYRNTKISSLSKGMQQKIQIIATIISDPQVIIFDEPFSGLDPLNIYLIKQLLNELKNQDRIILLSTHQMNMVEELCDTVLILNKGKKLLYGDLAEIRTKYSPDEYIVGSTANYESIEVIDQVVNHSNGYDHIILKERYSANDLLLAIINQGAKIEHFEKRLISLEDLFIKLVRDDVNKQD